MFFKSHDTFKKNSNYFLYNLVLLLLLSVVCSVEKKHYTQYNTQSNKFGHSIYDISVQVS